MSGISEDTHVVFHETLKSQIDRLAKAILGDNGEHPAWQGESLGACDLAIKIMSMDKKEVSRLRAELAYVMAIGGVNFCHSCGDKPVVEEKGPFCSECRVAIGQSEMAS